MPKRTPPSGSLGSQAISVFSARSALQSAIAAGMRQRRLAFVAVSSKLSRSASKASEPRAASACSGLAARAFVAPGPGPTAA